MKRLLMACCLMAATAAMVFAAIVPKPTDFSGSWSLDMSKSKLPQPGGGGGGGGGGMGGGSPMTGQTLTVKQDEKTISIETKTEGGMGGGGSQTATFNLDGSETKTEMVRGEMKIPVTMKAKANDNGSLELTRVTKFTGPDGAERVTTTKETWEITDGGKTLKVHRVSESPRGTQESDWVYTKK